MKTHIFKIDDSFDLSLLSDNDDEYNRQLLSLHCQSYIVNDGNNYADLLLEYYKTIYFDEIKYYYIMILEKHNKTLIYHEYKHIQFYDDVTKKNTYKIDRIKTNSCTCIGTMFTDTVSKYKQYLDINNYYYYEFKKYQYHLFIDI